MEYSSRFMNIIANKAVTRCRYPTLALEAELAHCSTCGIAKVQL